MTSPHPSNQAAGAAAAAIDHKGAVRERVFRELREVAFPDSRFHYDFGEFITDFQGSDAALARLAAHRFYRDARCIFITPDNCLEMLRWQALRDGKQVLMTTYSIRRGFWMLEPSTIPADRLLHAATLDGMERYGVPLSLTELRERVPRVDFLVTGTGAINEAGVRFGKGHGFFDAEWGMLYRIGLIDSGTPAAAVVHDCQVLTETLYPEVFDTVVDAIFTPTRTIGVSGPHKPTCGIVWDLLDPKMYDTIPPLQELRMMEPQLPAVASR